MITRTKDRTRQPKQIQSFLLTSTNNKSKPNFSEPKTFKSAIKHQCWKQAMDDEYTALVFNNTRTLVL